MLAFTGKKNEFDRQIGRGCAPAPLFLSLRRGLQCRAASQQPALAPTLPDALQPPGTALPTENRPNDSLVKILGLPAGPITHHQ